jgi:RimJ/RimL family protein N-acetyltransferase
MSAPPKTQLSTTPAEAEAIRAAVRDADPKTLGPARALADRTHIPALVDLLSDPAVSGPVYDLPKPITPATIAAWIEAAHAERSRGEGLLFVTADDSGSIVSYSRISVWPQLSAAELGGAMRADRQSQGAGRTGAARTVDWIFETLGVRLMCLTAALDNVRSARMIDHMGFQRMGERESMRADGTTRRSLYWELTREAWAAARSS